MMLTASKRPDIIEPTKRNAASVLVNAIKLTQRKKLSGIEPTQRTFASKRLSYIKLTQRSFAR
jgi:hypothetical protein